MRARLAPIGPAPRIARFAAVQLAHAAAVGDHGEAVPFGALLQPLRFVEVARQHQHLPDDVLGDADRVQPGRVGQHHVAGDQRRIQDSPRSRPTPNGSSAAAAPRRSARAAGASRRRPRRRPAPPAARPRPRPTRPRAAGSARATRQRSSGSDQRTSLRWKKATSFMGRALSGRAAHCVMSAYPVGAPVAPGFSRPAHARQRDRAESQPRLGWRAEARRTSALPGDAVA